jgi:hypothetical protein
MSFFISPSLLNFLSGLAAGAGINLLTSIEGGSTFSKGKIVVDSVIWVVDAVFLAYAAHVAETVERQAGLVINNRLTEPEQREIVRNETKRVRVRYTGSIVLGAIGMIVSMALVPGIGVWS